MPGNNGIPFAQNFIGRHTTAELAALPIEKVRQGVWCWNISNVRPEIYNGVAWVPFGGAGLGVNTEHAGVPVQTPATTINFNEGLDAAVVAGDTQVDVDWAEVGDLAPVAGANASGAGTEVPRNDHQHEGVHSVNGGGAGFTGDVGFTGSGAAVVSEPAPGTIDVFAPVVVPPVPGVGVLPVANASADGVSPNFASVDHEHRGVASLAELGQPAIYGDVRLVAGANVVIGQAGQNITIAASGALESASQERPDKFHYFKNAGLNEEYSDGQQGYPTQRCIARSETYKNTYYLFYTGMTAPRQEPTLMIRVEHLSTAPGVHTALDRCVWDVEIQIPQMQRDTSLYNLLHITPDDFALVIDDDDVLHVIFIGEDPLGRRVVCDALLDIDSILFLQAPAYATSAPTPAPMSVSVIAEVVTSTWPEAEDIQCDHVTAAFTAHSAAHPVGSTVIVGWRESQPPVPGYNILTNTYDPAGWPAFMYPGPDMVVDWGLDADWPTIEVGGTYVYMLYNVGGKPKFATSPFDYLIWNTLVMGTGISDIVVNCPPTTSPMSMCIARYDSLVDVIYFIIEDTTGQGEKYLVILLEDFLTTGVGVSYNISVYDTFNPLEDAYAYQLGISKVAWGPEEYAPTLFMLHYKHSVPILDPDLFGLEVHLTILIPTVEEGIVASDLPIVPNSYVMNGEGAKEPIRPKIHFAFEEYNRVWAGDVDVDYAYYPIMVYATMEKVNLYDGLQHDAQSLWIKDIPEYPYLQTEKPY